MVWQKVRIALLTGCIVATVAFSARAEDAPKTEATPAAPSTASCCTVCVKEWVPEQYQCTRTTYHKECKQETYTAYRCECVPETRTYTCTVYKQVPEVREEKRTVCVKVPCVEEKTVMQACWTCKPCTTTVRKCVDKGHYECREVPCGPTLRERFHKMCSHNSCGCETSCCETSCCPPRTKTVKCWVPCKVWEEHQCTTMKRVCEYKPVTCKVNTCKTEMRTEICKVTVCKCVAEQQTKTCTVNVMKKVPYQATRTVEVCVPRTETVTACRMVCRTVQKQVACCESSCGSNNCGTSNCCSNNCAKTSCCKAKSCCEPKCSSFSMPKFKFSCSGLTFRHNSGCNSGCNTGCCN